MQATEPLRVLVVEDDPVFQHLLAAWLEADGGFVTESATSLLATRDRLRGGEPLDAILLDLNLSDSSGLDTVEVIQALVPSVPIIILTGMEEAGQGVAAVRAGAQDLLTKAGITREDLCQEIRMSVARARHEQERMGILGEDMERRLRTQLESEKTRFYQAAARNLREPLGVLAEDIRRLQRELHDSLSLDQLEVLREMETHVVHIRELADDLEHVSGLEASSARGGAYST